MQTFIFQAEIWWCSALRVSDVMLVAINCNNFHITPDHPPYYISAKYSTRFFLFSHLLTYVYSFSDFVPATATTFKVSMSPWTNYTFRVIARNKVGDSLPSGHSKVCLTPEDVPYKNPDNVMGRGHAPNNLVISWTVSSMLEFWLGIGELLNNVIRISF